MRASINVFASRVDASSEAAVIVVSRSRTGVSLLLDIRGPFFSIAGFDRTVRFRVNVARPATPATTRTLPRNPSVMLGRVAIIDESPGVQFQIRAAHRWLKNRPLS